MKRLFQVLLAMLGLSAGCSKSGVVSPSQFTQDYAASLRSAMPGSKVEIVKDLEVRITKPDGHTLTSYLDNAYNTYKKDPANKDEIIGKFMTPMVAGIGSSEQLDTANIVPVIKDRPWLEETRQALRARGAKEVPKSVYEEYNDDLIIVYVEDQPKGMRYLTPDDLPQAKIREEDLRKLACSNLSQLVTNVSLLGAKGIYMLSAGGDYDASLLLLDTVWERLPADVQGEVVVAIPARGEVMVSGTQVAGGIESLQRFVKSTYAKAPYQLTPKLFVRRNGKFVTFEP